MNKVEDDFLKQEWVFYGQATYWKTLFAISKNFVKYKKIKDFNKPRIFLNSVGLFFNLFFKDYRIGVCLLSRMLNDINKEFLV
jgi:hypothetical protein